MFLQVILFSVNRFPLERRDALPSSAKRNFRKTIFLRRRLKKTKQNNKIAKKRRKEKTREKRDFETDE